MLLTTCWVGAPATASLSAADPVMVFPQIAAGGVFQMEVNLTNPGQQAQSGTLVFRDDRGEPLELMIDGKLQSSVDFVIPPGGARKIRTDAAGPVKVGYALLFAADAGSPLVGSVVFTVNNTFDVSVPNAKPVSSGHVFIERSRALDSGMAFANPGDIPLNIRLSLRTTEGSEALSSQLQLPARHKVAAFLPELLKDPPLDFVGTLHFTADAPFHMLALRQRATGSLATMPGSASAFSPDLPIGSQLLFLIDSGVNMRTKGFTSKDLENNTVRQLTGITKAVNRPRLRVRNTHATQAVTIQFFFLNDACQDYLDFLAVLKCGETLTFDPLDMGIPGSPFKTSDLLFGSEAVPDEMAREYSAARFGSGRFVLSLVAVGLSTDADNTADLLFPNEIAPIGECGVTPLNSGSRSGRNSSNLHVANRRMMSFDFLTGAAVPAQNDCADPVAVRANAELVKVSAFTRQLTPWPAAGAATAGWLILAAPVDCKLHEALGRLVRATCGSAELPVSVAVNYGVTYGLPTFRLLD
jgi:hypothetical protein